MASVLTPGNDAIDEANPEKILGYSRGLVKSTGSLLKAVMVKEKDENIVTVKQNYSNGNTTMKVS